MNKPELLAPAGGMEHFIAAAENGADAIYFGGQGFNARQYASNFTADEMKEAVNYAHESEVKAYLTLNTLIKEREIKDALKQAEEGAQSGVDAFILQDWGLASEIKRLFPEVPRHLSTQATIYDVQGVRFAREQNFKRVVLAREMRQDEIKKCSSLSNIETEVFVHGALCMCLSGQCAMSRLSGKRSGNRGSCAQPCRMRYELETYDGDRIGEGDYLLSPKDISYLGEIAELIEAGVNSFKIEGRLKTPEYVALTVKTFRKYIDIVCENNCKAFVSSDDREKLLQVFSRGDFTKGYLYGKQNAALLSGESPKHRGLFIGVVKAVRTSAKNKDKKLIEVNLRRDLNVGDGIEIIGRDFPGGVVSFIRGKSGPIKGAKTGDTVWLGDIPGNIRSGESVYKITDKKLITEIRAGIKKHSTDKLPIKMKFTAKEGAAAVLTVEDPLGKKTTVSGTVVLEIAEHRPVDASRVETQLRKTGNTAFEVVECVIDMEEKLLIPIGEINKLRREALEKIENED